MKMETQEFAKFADRIIYSKTGKHLDNLQIDILNGALAEHGYKNISRITKKTEVHIRKEAALLWKILSHALDEKITKSNCRETLRRAISLEQNQVNTNPQKPESVSFSSHQNWTEQPLKLAKLPQNETEHNQNKAIYGHRKDVKYNHHQDWGNAPDVPSFFGRESELTTLKRWILDDHCRLVAILGIGGIGKTDLSLKLALGIQDKFEYVIWRSLLNQPPATEILADLIQFLSNQEDIAIKYTVDKQISLLIEYLKKHRCLLILDNVESILEAGNYAVKFKKEYKDYGELFEKLGTVLHQSCLLITSREKINNLERLEGKYKPIRFLELPGLNALAGQYIFKEIGDFYGSDDDWKKLIEFYNGNPLALELAAHHIKDVFAGDISESLQEAQPIFAELCELLDWHFARLSSSEKEILYWLAIHREPICIATLKDDLVSKIAKESVLKNFRSLQSKLPLEKSENARCFTLQPVLIEYITEKLVEQVCQEIQTGEIKLFNSHALLQAQAKDYIIESQSRTIVEKVIQILFNSFKFPENLETKYNFILLRLRKEFSFCPGYAGGNILNMLCQLNVNLNSYDFSYLTIWQAYLQGKNLQYVDFSYSDLTKSVFTQSFGGIHALAFSPDGEYLAAGDSNGQIHLLRIEDEQPIATFQKHGWWTVSIAFSPNGQKLVSSSLNGTIKLWNVKTNQCLYNLEGHTNWIWAVTFSPDGQMIASGSNDNTIRLWDANTGECITILEGHTSWVLAIAFSSDGKTIVSTSYDKTIKLWDLETFKCFNTIQGHEDAIWSVAFSPDDRKIASCGCDKTIRLWSAETGECLNILRGHKKEIKVLAFSPDGKTIASGCFEPTIKFWDVETGECRVTAQGHSNAIRTLAFSSNNKTVATGDNDQIVKLWDAQTGKCLKTFQGYTDCVWSVAFSFDGKIIASSHLDYVVRLWDAQTGECLKTLPGHTALIWSVAFNPVGQTIASSADDETIRLWNINTGQFWKRLQYPTDKYQGGIWTLAFSPNGQLLASGGQDTTVKVWDIDTANLKVLEGHRSWIWTVAFSPNGKILASGSDDQTVKVWDIMTGQCLYTLQGHTNNVRSVAFSPDGKLLVSGSEDSTLKLWDISTGECLNTLWGHESLVWPVKFSGDGKFILSGSHDRTLKLWDANTGECLNTLQGHGAQVTSVAFSPDSQTLISGSLDGTIKFWHIKTNQCLRTLRVPRPYEGMKITGVKGLTDSQKEALKALGAVEN